MRHGSLAELFTAALLVAGAAILAPMPVAALDVVAVPVETRNLSLRDGSEPKARKLRFTARTKSAATGGRVVPPAVGSDGDPTLAGTGAGGELALWGGAGDGDGILVPLPASGWSRLGSASAPKGFRYRATDPDAAIQRVDVKADVIRIRGGGASFGYTLDEPAQGRVGLRLRLGAGMVWCADAPATRSERDRPGSFTATDVVAPGACETPPPAAACAPARAPAPGVAHTRRGTFTGVARGDTWAFLGIAFAEPPLGGLRWRPPVDPVCAPAPRAADTYGPQCPQYDEAGVVGNEDCLQLNVWTPRAPGPPRPVLVWIHGGAHEQGSGTLAVYDGQRLAEREGVVVVTINYRLGPFGFLAHPSLTAEGGVRASGNFGMLDQIQALAWVRDEIASFGGDPGRVTIFGQSAGGVSACRLLVSPLARGLFAGAILQSGPCVAKPLATAEQHGVTRVADALGCSTTTDVPACLRSRTTAEVMATLTPLTGGGTNSLGRQSYDGVIDGWALPDEPRARIEAGDVAPVPVLLGSTAAENGRFAPALASQAAYEAAVTTFLGLGPAVTAAAVAQYPAAVYGGFREAYIALTTDAKFTCQVRQDARRLAAVLPARRYWFDDVPDAASPTVTDWGAFHGIDILYAFATLEALGPIVGPADLALIGAMQGYWARFAATGDPNGGGAPAWATYDVASEPSLRLGTPIAVAANVRGANCDFWDALAGGA